MPRRAWGRDHSRRVFLYLDPVTHDLVVQAAEQLVAGGDEPSIIAVQARIGGSCCGSSASAGSGCWCNS